MVTISFDAGQIVAVMRLERTQFNLDADAVIAKEKELGKTIDASVKPELDDKAMETVLVEEAPLRADIKPEVKPTYDSNSAEQVGRNLAADIFKGASSGSGDKGGSGVGAGLITSLLGQGLNQSEITSALKNLGFGGSEIKGMLGGALLSELTSGGATDNKSLASGIVQAMLPSAQEFQVALGDGLHSMIGSGSSSDKSSGKWNIATALSSIIARDLSGAQSQLGSGGTDLAGKGKMTGSFLPATIIDTIAKDVEGKILGDLTGSGGKSSGGEGSPVSGILRLLGSMGGIGSGLSSAAGSVGTWATGLGADVQGLLPPGFKKGLALAIAAGAVAAIPLAGALGLAAGGAVAGTAIGGIGTGIYGLLAMGAIKDLSSAYSAHQQLASGQITQAQYQQLVAGLAPAAIKAASGSLGTLGAKMTTFNNTIIHPLQDIISGQITGLVSAAVKNMPAIGGFMKGAVKGMTPFINSVTKDLSSPGFAQFMKSMTPTMITLMGQFGSVILNLVSAFGSFLKIFGGVAAKNVGPWFVKVTKEFATFMSHVKLSPGFINGMKQAFTDLYHIVVPIWHGFMSLVKWLEPIGMLMLGLIADFVTFTARFMGIIQALVQGKFGKAWDILFGGLKEPVKQAWIDIENIFTTAVAWIGTNVITPVVNFFVALPGNIVKALGDFATTVWSVMVASAKWLDKNVWQPLSTFFTGLPKNMVTALGDIGKTVWSKIVAGAGWLDTNVWSPIATFFTGLPAKIVNAAKGMWHRVSDAFKVVINTIIGWWDSLHFTLPSIDFLGHHIGGGTIGMPYIPPMRATGGPVSAFTPYIVGERGPELFMSNSGGSIVPNNRLGGGNGFSLVIENIDARGATDPYAVGQAVRNGVNSTIPALRQALQRAS